MSIISIEKELGSNTYPGRGIVIGRSPDGKKTIVVYFIMGRSTNSRNRIFTYTDDGIKTEAFDPAKMIDPSLVIYHPVRFFDGYAIVTNGDQTDTIRDFIEDCSDFRSALMTREFEPDSPNFTPRISGIVMPDGSYKLSILKSADGNPSCCCRYFFEYDKPIAGEGHMIHTYLCDGTPIPSYEGEPKTVYIDDSLNDYAYKVGDALNADNKVSLYACEIDIETGDAESVIINKNN